MSAINPYAPPQADLEATLEGQHWRDGKILVLRPGSALPHRCIKCNAPAELPIKKRKIYWHHPAWYILIFIAILLYAVIALAVRKKAEIQPGLCATHSKRRKIGLSLIWGGLLLGVGLMFAGAVDDAGALAALGGLVLLIGLIWGSIFARLLTPNRIDKDFIRLRGAGKDFLDSLPAFPGR